MTGFSGSGCGARKGVREKAFKMIVAFMAAGFMGGASALGCALLLELPILLILAAYPAGGFVAVIAIGVLALAAPAPRRVMLRAPSQV